MKYAKWLRILTPLYDERETRNMWRWYIEANRPEYMFEEDLGRLAKYYPIQYLTGYAWFYGEKFYVNEHTLIPRPETEELVHKVLEDHPGNHYLKVIDLGTGTGCIPIILKKHRPEWEISGLEWYEDTLRVARKNEQLHHSGIHWMHANILDLPADTLNSYDLIISNPPYISPDEKPNIERNVLDFEPHQALFTQDQRGLEFYKTIARSGQMLKSGVEIYLEIHHNHARAISNLFRDSNTFSSREIVPDMQGKNRILKVVRK